MMDPFHKNNYLSSSRARISGKSIIKYMEQKGYELKEKSGILFFPIRILISQKWDMKEAAVKKMFYFGENFSGLFSKYFWSDYKILGFRKK